MPSSPQSPGHIPSNPQSSPKFIQLPPTLSEQSWLLLKSRHPSKGTSISTLKFRKTFKFKFKETVESITEGLVNNWDTMKKTDRSEAFDYK